jgi:hypothetical protein
MLTRRSARAAIFLTALALNAQSPVISVRLYVFDARASSRAAILLSCSSAAS